MSAATRNFSIAQGEYFDRVLMFSVTDDSGVKTYIDLTGYEFEGQIRDSASDDDVNAQLNFDLIEVTREEQTFKAVEVTLDDGETGAMAARVYAYDIFWIPPAGHREPIMRGAFRVEGAITR